MCNRSESSAANAQHLMLGIGGGSVSTTAHPQAQWFPAAGLGLFLHWGLSSVHGGIDLSWGMIADTPWDAHLHNRNKLAPADYYALAEKFAPTHYDPDRYLAAAKQAGFRYAVFTTKHHDGFTLWPSRHSEIGTHTHLGGRDLVKPFVDACRRHGLKVGLYYSPPDWYFDRLYRSWGYRTAAQRQQQGESGFVGLDMHHRPAVIPPKPAGHDERRAELVRGEVEELLTRYGRIDLFWFDGGAGEMPTARVREMQPHIVVNSRNGDAGDYLHTECRLPHEPFTGWFETCHVCGHGGWGYQRPEKWWSAGELLSHVVRLRTWGGNFLANAAVRPDGDLFPTLYQRFEELAQWMRHSSESIHDTVAGPYPQRCNVPVTRRPGVWYLHALPDFKGPIVVRDAGPARSARLMRTGESLALEQRDGGWRLEIPPQLRTDSVDVVAVQTEA